MTLAVNRGWGRVGWQRWHFPSQMLKGQEPCMTPTLALFPEAFTGLLPSPGELFLWSTPHHPVGLSLDITWGGGVYPHLQDQVRAPVMCSHRSLHFSFKSLVTLCNSLLASVYLPTWLQAPGGQKAWHGIMSYGEGRREGRREGGKSREGGKNELRKILIWKGTDSRK